jgi:ABC-type transporter Mla subunit MlaD
MANEQKGLEIKVGVFVFIGLAVIAAMAIQFGRVGQGLSKFYTLTVAFPNASGLVKNADVQLGGARIGVVAEEPKVVPGQIGHIPVKLNIREEIELPRGSYFVIGSSGLLGDKSVVVGLPTGFDASKFDSKDSAQTIPHGSIVEGTQLADINDLTNKGDKNMEKLADALDELKGTLQKVQSGMLNDENMSNLKSTFDSLKTSTDNIAKASTKIDGIVTSAQSAVDSAKDTFAEAKQTMGTINDAAADVRAVVADARGVVKTSQSVLKAAQNGQGTLPMLLGDRETADNLSALIANIRRHGLLFYRDSVPEPPLKPASAPATRKKP